MKKIITSILFILLASVTIAQDLLNEPQKIVIDSERNRYIVSNYGSLGDLIQIDSLGVLDTLVIDAGMNDGMQIVGDTVYGSGSGFNGRVLGYDLTTGNKVMDINIAGVQHLSSFVVDSMGILYTSERFGNRIFKINPKTQEYWVWAEGGGLDEPNGLLYEPEFNRMLVCLDQSNPPILAINLTDSTVYTITTTNLGGSDGIAKDMEGNYYITGYELPGIYKFNPDFSGEPELFYEDNWIIYPTFHQEHNSLLVTLYWQNDWVEVFLDTNTIATDELEKSFSQFNCFPNPFVEQTTIEFELKCRALVRIDIFGQNSKKIRTIINEMKLSGTHSIIWDAKDQSGKKVSNGTYYFKLTVDGLTETRTVVLLK